MLVVLLSFIPKIIYARDVWFEGWESSPLGKYVPGVNEIISGDTGNWEIGDTVSTECPEVPVSTAAEILKSSEGKYLQLTAVNSGSDCSDNIWVSNLPLVNVTITNNTILLFEEYGYRGVEEPFDHAYCYFCAIEFTIIDNYDNVIIYTLQEHPSFKPLSGYKYTTIRLGGSGGIYGRNLYEDFMTVNGFTPVGAEVSEVIFEIDGPVDNNIQWATIDNILITRGTTPPPPLLTSFNLSLKKGWNLISIPLNLLNKRIEPIFGNVSIYGYKNNLWFVPTEIDNRLGYWVKVNQSKNITLVGTKLGRVATGLNDGWNLIGYPSLNESLINKTLKYVNYSVVYAYDGWSSYVPNRKFNTLTIMKLGYGYWVNVLSNNTLLIS